MFKRLAGGFADPLLRDQAARQAPPFHPRTQAAIERALPDVTANNPLDMGAMFLSGDGRGLSTALSAMDADPGVDNLVLSINPMLDGRAADFTAAILRGLSDVTKPVAVLSYDPRLESYSHRAFREAGFPVLYPAEIGVAALKTWTEHGLDKPSQTSRAEPATSGAREDAQRRLQQAVATGRTIILEDEAKALVGAWGVPCAQEAIAGDENQAAAVAAQLGYPVALKILSKALLHRGVGNGVLLSLKDDAAVRDGYRRVVQRTVGLGDARILVQRMAEPGHEFLVGAARDAEVGLVLAISKGGGDVESAGEALFNLLPVDRARLRRSLAGWAPIANIERHDDSIDLDALVEVAGNVGDFLADNSEQVQELDLNPVIVGRKGAGAVVVDALLILKASADRTPRPLTIRTNEERTTNA